MRVYQERDRQEMRLNGALLGSGGEASIHAVPGRAELAAKIYHHPTPEHAAKLQAMLAAPPADPMAGSGHVSIAWPMDRLLGGDGQVAGYLMPRVQNARLIQEFYNPRARQQACPRFHYGYLLRTARNLAAAVRALHERGYVVGDLNESNLLVTNQALVTLVDTDSFQVPAPGRTFRCRVGKPEYTPPELQGGRFADLDRKVEHDAFGLGVLVFQLLMQGLHPFAGVFNGSGEPDSVPQRISAGYWSYARRTTPFRPSPHAPPWSILPPSVAELMRRCFEEGHERPQARPGATEWQHVLQEAEKEMVTCLAKPLHQYHQRLAACPWCALARQQGRDPFPGDGKAPRRSELRIDPPPPTMQPQPASTEIRRTSYPIALPVAIPAASPASSGRSAGAFLFAVAFGGCLLAALLTAGLLGWSITHRHSDAPRQDRPGDGALLAKGTPSDSARAKRRFTGHTGRVTSVAFAPNGRGVLSASADRTIRLWEAQSGRELRRFNGHTNAVRSAVFLPDGLRVLSASDDRTLRLWDVETSQQSRRFDGHQDQVMSVALSADGRLALSGSYDESVRWWPLSRGGVGQLNVRDMINSVALTADGKRALLAGNQPVVRLWDLDQRRELHRLTGHTGYVLSVALSPDGRFGLSGGSDGTMRSWDCEGGRELRRFSGHDEQVNAVAFAAGGRLALSASGDNTVRVWEVDTGRELFRGQEDALGLTSVALYGTQLVAGAGDGSILVWELPQDLLARAVAAK